MNALHRAAIRYGLTGEGWDDYEAALTAALESDLAGHGGTKTEVITFQVSP